jgi:hypothetical protein
MVLADPDRRRALATWRVPLGRSRGPNAISRPDFFDAIPSGSRAFVITNIIHDWNDAQACKILRNCRRVPDDGVLLLIEYCLGEDNTPSVGKMVDLVMLTITGGKGAAG